MKFLSVSPFIDFIFMVFPLVGLLSLTMLGCTLIPKSRVELNGSQVFHRLIISDHWIPKEVTPTNSSLVNELGETLLIHELADYTEQDFFDLSTQKLQAFATFLHPQADPYFGAREVISTCDERNLSPISDGRNPESIFKMGHFFSTANFIYGACTESLDVLKSQVLWLYCRHEKRLIELRYFYARSEPWHLEPIAKCAK